MKIKLSVLASALACSVMYVIGRIEGMEAGALYATGRLQKAYERMVDEKETEEDRELIHAAYQMVRSHKKYEKL